MWGADLCIAGHASRTSGRTALEARGHPRDRQTPWRVPVRVFGSFARGEQRADSDLDLLIDVTGPTTPWFPGGLIEELKELLGRKVGVGEEDWMRPRVRASALHDAVDL